MPKRSSIKRDVNQIALDVAAAIESGNIPKMEDGRNPMAVAMGRLGGLKGGRARAASMTDKERSEIAKKAAQARWSRHGNR